MNHQPSQKFWMPRYQADMSLEELEYRRMLARDQELLVRETPPSSLEQWRMALEKARAL